MTALAKERNTIRKAVDGAGPAPQIFPVNGGDKIWQGGIVVLNSEGNATKGVTGTGLTVVGRAEQTVDNTAGADAALTIEVRAGVFKWANSAAGDAITKADVGKVCYLVDDQTVAKTSNAEARSAAGIVYEVDTDGGVWVAMGLNPSAIGALGLAALTVA